MARHTFGGGIADYVVQYGEGGELRLAANAQITFWDASSGGAQITELVDMTDEPIANGVVTADGNGAIPAFGRGPEGVRAMWAAASLNGQGPRRLMLASDSGDELADIQGRLVEIEEKLSGVGVITVAPTAPTAPGIGDVWIDTSTPSSNEPLAFRAASGAAGNFGPSITCPLPNGIVPGDYVIAVLSLNANAGQNIAPPPAGWTELVPSVLIGGDTRAAVYGTTYAAGQPDPTWTFTADVKATVGLAAYANADPDVQVGAVYQRSAVVAEIDAPSITTTEPGMRVVCAYAEKSTVATVIDHPPGTERRLAQFGNGANTVPSVLLCDFAQPVAGATGTRTAVWNVTSNNGLGVQIGLRRRSE
ncbi:hypothetical protein BZB76_6129 [Actinomadura pelletieri DSM 43383]|uniref:Uncharacterized protein n=1 Tax=Actinomadura pelletieri DSM 43383 TaxID=1120940 RepID=A0A495QBD6_9ACTN|nr:hypothetical protein [Actinomadura pelletieri]RKS68990.1 hypothetical protein BZB76_6129 [Actinomadura pelletieri DSM 43383]